MLSDAPFEVPAYLLEKAKTLPRSRMAIAGADNEIVLQSVRQASDAGLIEPVLIGDGGLIRSVSDAIGWDIGECEIINTNDEKETSDTAVSLAADGRVQAVMKGHVHTEAIMRAVLDRDAGLRTARRVSHVFHMTIPGRDKVLLLTDCAVNIQPDVKTKVDIINNAVQLAHALGNPEPKVALLSGAETVNPSMPSSVDAAEIVEKAEDFGISGCLIDGPFGFDIAVSPDAAAIKGMQGPVAGQADILVVPNIETGNGLFKMMVYFISGLAAGIVLGTRAPIVLTSRADPPEARFAATILAAIIAQKGD